MKVRDLHLDAYHELPAPEGTFVLTDREAYPRSVIIDAIEICLVRDALNHAQYGEVQTLA